MNDNINEICEQQDGRDGPCQKLIDGKCSIYATIPHVYLTHKMCAHNNPIKVVATRVRRGQQKSKRLGG